MSKEKIIKLMEERDRVLSIIEDLKTKRLYLEREKKNIEESFILIF